MKDQKLYKAAKQAIKNVIGHPATQKFPVEIINPPAGYRGPPILDPSKCTLCLRCTRVCPTGALIVTELNETESEFVIDLGRCCYCGECVDACTFNAITLTEEWLTADSNRETLKHKNLVHKPSKKKKSALPEA